MTDQVGDDEHGSAYRRNLVEQGVDIRHLGEEKGVSKLIYAVCTVQCIVCSVQCIVCCFSVCSIQCSVFSVLLCY